MSSMSGLFRALPRAISVFICCAAIFAQAVPWIRRENSDARGSAPNEAGGAANDLAVHGGSLIEADMTPGLDSVIDQGESSTTTETARLWSQFQVLDGRFAEAAAKYMRASRDGKTKEVNRLQREGRRRMAPQRLEGSFDACGQSWTMGERVLFSGSTSTAACKSGEFMGICRTDRAGHSNWHECDQSPKNRCDGSLYFAKCSNIAKAFSETLLEEISNQEKKRNLTQANQDVNRTLLDGVISILERSPKPQAKDVQVAIKVEDSDMGNLKTSAKRKQDAVPYGFFVHAFYEAAAIVNQLRSIRKFYPEAPVYVMSDGGVNFSGICDAIGNCKFAWKAPAHDCWNPKPFLDRFREGALWLDRHNAEFTIFLEPDVTLHKRASRPLRQNVAAGGLKDEWNPSLPIKLRELAQDLGRKFSGNKNFTITWDRFGLAGGSIILTRAAIIAFRPDYINWLEFEKLYNKEVYSSDIAMLIALAAHGFDYYPWPEVSQPSNKPQYDHETAFQHHSSGEKGGKPLYGKQLALEDRKLISPPPNCMQPLRNSQCQHCVWVDEAECWPKHLNGKSELEHIECPAVDEDTFRRQTWNFKKETPKPHLFRDLSPQLVE